MALNYKRIPSSQVSREINLVARRAARDAARILNLGPIHIQWVERYPNEKAMGWVDPRWPEFIHLAADVCERLGASQTRALVFHEARHIWQDREARYIAPGEIAQREDDAESFSYRHCHVLIEGANYQWK